MLKELNREFDLHVYYFSDASIKGGMDKGFGQNIKWDVPLLEGYNYTFIKNYSSRKSLSNKLFDLFNPSAVKVLFKSPSKIFILNGWAYLSDLIVIFTAKIFGKKIWLRAENPLSQETGKSRIKVFIKKIFLQHFLFKFFVHRFLYIGTQNKLFFKYYGVAEDKLVYTPYSVDNSSFDVQYQSLRDKKEDTKALLNIPTGKKIVLFSGKYIEKKRPLDLLKAVHALNDESVLLVMMGDGALRSEMEDYINANKMNNVILTGFVNQSLVPKYYSIADLFVMCSGSGETWGLSVNEAMNFALPVIISSTSGCSSDLVEHGKNGFIFEEGNIDELIKCLRGFLYDDVFRKSSGELSKGIVQDYSIQKIVKNLEVAVNETL
ncbi:MAG TPA: glycosyltransferase family 4 protein [Puia sp.]|nr:glycosyltransferase family 4 protein [Puia sp.]